MDSVKVQVFYMEQYPEHLMALASFRKFMSHSQSVWPEFLQRRSERLVQADRNGKAPEKVAEDILGDFFTMALDWKVSDINNQLDFADLVLTTLGIKRILVEAKRPGSLAWNRPGLEQALGQARRYADEQRVNTIAISDGCIFYAADIVNGGLSDRVRLRLDGRTLSPNSWWVSVDGIYRPVEDIGGEAASAATLDNPAAAISEARDGQAEALLHPKYKVPAECFAYVGDASNPATWKLPHRFADGRVDEKHLCGAIRAVVSNYRGARVKTIPEQALPDVLVRLGKAAAEAGRLPGQDPDPRLSYQQLHDVLRQLDKLSQVLP